LFDCQSRNLRGVMNTGLRDLDESRPQESEQDDKWSFCLTAGTLCPANQEKQ
jgi:hypothetical protein